MMIRKYLISNDHRVAYTTMSPEMNVAPELQCTITPMDQHRINNYHSPADAGRTNVHKDLTITRFETGFLYQMYLMLRVIECCDVCIFRACLARLQDSELGMVQDLARVIDLAVRGSCLCRVTETYR